MNPGRIGSVQGARKVRSPARNAETTDMSIIVKCYHCSQETENPLRGFLCEYDFDLTL
jgi:hypothetical protein